MKLVSLIFILVLTAACGKSGGGSSGSGSAPQNQDSTCSLNGRAVACESIQGADGLGIDLLESMVDVPAKIEASQIIFMSDKADNKSGRRISCKTAVKNGEIYRYALRGDTLVLMTGEGSYEMKRLSSGSDINGLWSWKGYIDQGTHVLKTMTVIGGNRVIMRTSCEL